MFPRLRLHWTCPAHSLLFRRCRWIDVVMMTVLNLWWSVYSSWWSWSVDRHHLFRRVEVEDPGIAAANREEVRAGGRLVSAVFFVGVRLEQQAAQVHILLLRAWRRDNLHAFFYSVFVFFFGIVLRKPAIRSSPIKWLVLLRPMMIYYWLSSFHSVTLPLWSLERVVCVRGASNWLPWLWVTRC